MFIDEYKKANDKIKLNEELLCKVLNCAKHPIKLKDLHLRLGRPLHKPLASVLLLIGITAICIAIIIFYAKDVLN